MDTKIIAHKKILIIYLALAILLIHASYSQDLTSYEYIKIKIEYNISFAINMGDDFKLSHLTLTSFFLPQTYNNSQYLNDFNTDYKYYTVNRGIDSSYLIYKYNENTIETNNNITNNFIVESIVEKPKIKEKIQYPLLNINQSYKEYLEFEKYININEKIKNKASNLAQGEDDLFVIATKIAKWIREDINYDLTTISENPNQKSTQVFETKTGVCREITNLYISMIRSLGIPARVVTGYSYTNSEELTTFLGSNWGGHVWAEVLIGETWVPFDLTYNQYGYVDATHIIIDKSASIRESSIKINASGYDFSLVDNSLKTNIEFTILDSKEKIYHSGFDINLTGPKEIGSNSYGYIEINAHNSKNYYQILFLKIAKTKEVDLVGNDEKMIIFKPNEKKKIFFKYKLPEIEKGYIYTFPFTIYNDFYEESFTISGNYNYKTIESNDLPDESLDDSKTLSNNSINIKCNYIFDIPEHSILCTIKNKNNFEIDNAKICSLETCQNINLKLNDEKIINFETSKNTNTINLTSNFENLSIDIKLEKPQISFSLNEYDNKIKINFNVTNHKENMQINIYENSNLVETLSISNKEFIITPKIENTSITLELEYKDIIIDTKTQTIFIKKNILKNLINNNEDKENDNESENNGFWQKLIEWIKNLFSF